MATIERRTGDRDGWRVRWWTIDKRQRSRKCRDLKTAQRLAADIERCHSRGVEWEPETARDRASLTVVAGAYQDHRRIRVAPHTLRVEGAHLDVFLRFCGERRVEWLDELARPLMDDFLGWLLAPGAALHGGQRKPQSASRIVGAALLLWQWAEDSGRWPDPPRAPRSLDLPRSPPPIVVAPTWEEMDAVIAVADGWRRRLAVWLRYTGLRVGESMRVEWGDVDMQAGRLTLRPEIEKVTTGRTVPLHPALLAEMAGWGVREGYVVAIEGRTDREPRSRDMARLWASSGVRPAAWKGHPDHAFRRGFKSGLVSAGANVDAVDFLQGHSHGGSRGRYLDGQALPLMQTLAMVPPVRVPGVSPSRVVRLPQRR